MCFASSITQYLITVQKFEKSLMIEGLVKKGFSQISFTCYQQYLRNQVPGAQKSESVVSSCTLWREIESRRLQRGMST